MTKLTLQQAMRMALDHHQAGRLEQAEVMYRQVLAFAPQYPDALHLLGVLASQNGNPDAAVGLIERAISVDPNNAVFHNNLGEALRRAGKTERAVECYQKAISLNPKNAGAHSNLGAALVKLGRLDEAKVVCNQAIQLDPNDIEGYQNLGIALTGLGQPEEAITVLRRALELRPENANAHDVMGDALRLANRDDQAIAAYQRSVLLKGNSANSFDRLGEALAKSGKLNEAIDSYMKMLALKPESPHVHNNLGLLLERSGRFDEALREYETAVSLGGSPEAHNNLGNYFGLKSNLDRAIAEYRKAIAVDESFGEAHSNLANALVETGQLDEAIAEYEMALHLVPSFAGARSNYLLAILYHPAFSPERLSEEHRRWEKFHGSAVQAPPAHENSSIPDRRLRIGYVSGDFRAHAVSFFSLPALTAHNHDQFEIFCYSNSMSEDLITSRFKKNADAWHQITSLSDERVCEMIREHKIDILVDLAGHTSGNRLSLFTMKPAPIQVSAWGYPHTTGLSSIDWRITDSYCDPSPNSQAFSSEKLLFLPETFWCYLPPESSPQIGPPPFEHAGQITFGSFNNLAKITVEVMQTWAKILLQVPNSRMILKASGFNSDLATQHVIQTFAQNGIPEDRLRLEGKSGFREYLELFNEVDAVLDSFPFNGGTTTCHALSMSVPVISLAGTHQASRMGVSLLNAVNTPELIGNSVDDYIRIAVDLALNPTKLGGLRSTMFMRLKNSPLLDARGYTRNLEEAYRRIWKSWCDSWSS